MKSPRVVVAEFMEADGLAVLEAGARVTYLPAGAEDRASLLAALDGAEALVVRNRVRVDADLLRAGPALRVVGRLGAGLDNVDLPACREAGVRVVHAPGANAAAVADYVFAALLHLRRRLGDADRAVRAGLWPREDFVGEELAGSTLGIVGVGAVGRQVAERARAFGMAVWGFDPYVSAAALQAAGVRAAGFEELLAVADVLTLHVPLTPETHHLLGPAQFAALRPGAVLVNASRGAVVDETALLHALRQGRLGGAALDVREQEPPPRPDPLAREPRVLLTPHVAGWTRQALARIGRQVAAAVLQALGG